MVELLNSANEGYPDGYLSEFYKQESGELVSPEAMRELADGLASFIVIEITDTYHDGESDEHQMNEALRVMQAAEGQLQQVIQALYQRWAKTQTEGGE